MNDTSHEQEYLSVLLANEEEEDKLDIAHPEDRKESQTIGLESNQSPGLAIVVGHTARSTGAGGVDPISESEYDWNTAVAQKIKTACSQQSIGCRIFFRDGIGVKGAYAEVKRWKARMCVELHFNAFNEEVVGTETLHGVLPQSRNMAEIFHEQILCSFNRPTSQDRGIKQRQRSERGGKNLSQLDVIPTILVEPFFGDAVSDSQLAFEVTERYTMAFVSAYQRYLARLT